MRNCKRAVIYLDKLPGQENRDEQRDDVQNKAGNFSCTSSGPVVRKEGNILASSIGDDPPEIGTEVGRVDDLESSPSRCQHMSEERGNDVGNGLVEESHNRHPQNPKLECNEHDILALCVAQAEQCSLIRFQGFKAEEEHLHGQGPVESVEARVAEERFLVAVKTEQSDSNGSICVRGDNLEVTADEAPLEQDMSKRKANSTQCIPCGHLFHLHLHHRHHHLSSAMVWALR